MKVPIPDSDEVLAQKKREERNAKRRERYAKQKEENGETVKRRKTRKKKDQSPDTTQLDLMLMTVSTIVASRPDCEHWLLTEQEIKSVTEPLARIIAENESLKAMSEHADAIALVMACFTIFVPRLIITSQKVKEKKKEHVTGNKTNSKIGGEKGKTKGSSNNVVKQPSTGIPTNDTPLSFLGNAIG